MSDSTEKTINTTTELMIGGVLIGIFILVLAIVVGVAINANTAYVGTAFTTVQVANETAFANATGDTLSTANALGFKDPTILQVYNSTVLINKNNVSVTAAGVLKNASAISWNNLTITYTYAYNTNLNTTANAGFTSVRDNTIGMFINFFAMLPTVGTIFAVIILIAGIVLLVMYVKKMKDNDSSGGYTG